MHNEFSNLSLAESASLQDLWLSQRPKSSSLLPSITWPWSVVIPTISVRFNPVDSIIMYLGQISCRDGRWVTIVRDGSQNGKYNCKCDLGPEIWHHGGNGGKRNCRKFVDTEPSNINIIQIYSKENLNQTQEKTRLKRSAYFLSTGVQPRGAQTYTQARAASQYLSYVSQIQMHLFISILDYALTKPISGGCASGAYR